MAVNCSMSSGWERIDAGVRCDVFIDVKEWPECGVWKLEMFDVPNSLDADADANGVLLISS